ncbi:hypothetical protein CR513_58802, partial [Mucuna pruriens]
MHRSDENQDISVDLTGISCFSTHMLIFNDKNKVDDVHVTCHDHIEGEVGIWFKSFVATQAKTH